MPYKSKKQETYLRSQKPKVAAKFDKHSGGKKPSSNAKRSGKRACGGKGK